MKVKELILILKGLPQNLDVCFSAQDNHAWEIANFVNSVQLFDKKVVTLPDYVTGSDVEWYYAQPERAVVLRG